MEELALKQANKRYYFFILAFLRKPGERTKEDIWPVSNVEKGVPKVISGKANVTRVGNAQ